MPVRASFNPPMRRSRAVLRDRLALKGTKSGCGHGGDSLPTLLPKRFRSRSGRPPDRARLDARRRAAARSVPAGGLQRRDRRWCVRAKPARSNGAMAQRPGQQQSWVPLDFPSATRRLRDLSGAIMPHVWHTGMLTPWDSVNDHASHRSRGHRSRQNAFSARGSRTRPADNVQM
jgi:hypothetical protein